MYSKLITLHKEENTQRSPLVFVHGFPDSPEMFAAYYAEALRQEGWVRQRSLYAIAFPNRHSNAARFPSSSEMANGVLTHEFTGLMDQLIAESPTGQIIPIVHDWGATYTWRYIRAGHEAGIERIVSLSVGSSLRYDIREHGLRALGWLYALLFSLPHYIPLPIVRRTVASIIVRYGGYQSPSAMELYKDAYHYWDGPRWLIRLPFRALGLAAYLPSYTSFPFPVLYLRSTYDRIASTSAFEKTLVERSDCVFHIIPGVNHWFPEQQSELVLPYLRDFLA